MKNLKEQFPRVRSRKHDKKDQMRKEDIRRCNIRFRKVKIMLLKLGMRCSERFLDLLLCDGVHSMRIFSVSFDLFCVTKIQKEKEWSKYNTCFP